MTSTAPSVVVGIDGSRAASRAAVWAIDEAISRDIPLRLVAVAEHAGADDKALGGAQAALRAAEAAVTSAGRPVTVQSAAVTGAPTLTLLEASRTAAMICVGAVGLRHFEHDRLGSTAGALAASAHCPVAVVRGGEHRRSAPGAVVVESDGTPESAAVLQTGVAEARLRGAPLRVLGEWRSRDTDSHDRTAPDGNRMVHAHLDRRLSHWRHRYPDLDARPVAVRGSALSYLTEHAREIQLVVVGARNSGGVAELLGPAGQAALHDTGCSILVVDPQRLL